MFAIESRNPVDSFLWQGGTVSPLEEKKRNRDRVASRLKSLELSLTEQFKSRPPVKMPKDKFLSTLEVLMEDIISNHQHQYQIFFHIKMLSMCSYFRKLLY